MSLCSAMTWLPRAYLPAPVQLPTDDDVSRVYEAAARHGGHRHTAIKGMLSIRLRPSIESEVSGPSETSVSWAGRDLMQGQFPEQRSRVGGNTPIGQSACDLPRGMSILSAAVDRLESPAQRMLWCDPDSRRQPSGVSHLITLGGNEWANLVGQFRPAAGNGTANQPREPKGRGCG